jgi:hypothetical protein
MNGSCQNRLTFVGPVKELRTFDRDEDWTRSGGVKHVELLEHSPDRHAWQFDAAAPPLAFLRSISRQWPLTFLLAYDCEDQSLKGLIKARTGHLRQFRVTW